MIAAAEVILIGTWFQLASLVVAVVAIGAIVSEAVTRRSYRRDMRRIASEGFAAWPGKVAELVALRDLAEAAGAVDAHVSIDAPVSEQGAIALFELQAQLRNVEIARRAQAEAT